MTKAQQKEIKAAKRLINKICKVNGLAAPKCVIKDLDNSLGEFHRQNPKYIYVDVNKCKTSTKRINSSFIKDRTITGVAIHELAHYIHVRSCYNQLNRRFKRLKEPLIHFYETNIVEDIAESIRLFILNPTLLKQGRPKRYKILSEMLKGIDNTNLSHLSYENRAFVNNWIEGLC